MAGTIVGCRLGLSEHRGDNASVFADTTRLTVEDRAAISEVIFFKRGGLGDRF